MADFKFVAVGVLKENGVIAGAVLGTDFRAFNVAAAGFTGHLSHRIHGFASISPKRNSGPVRSVIGLLGKSKKIYRLAAFRFKQSPFFATFINPKSDGREKLIVKTLRCFAVLYPEIDMIKKSSAHH